METGRGGGAAATWTFRGDGRTPQVRRVVAPADERLYTACFARRDVDVDAFAALRALAVRVDASDSADAADRLVVREGAPAEDFLVLTSGAASSYVDGVRVQAFAEPPYLLGAPPVLAALVAAGGGAPARAEASVVLEPGATALAWRLDDLRRAARRDALLAAGLRALHESLLRERGATDALPATLPETL